MAKQNVRVLVPKNPEELLKLADMINKKHILDGAASPLNQLEDYNWTDNGPNIAPAQTFNDDAKQMGKDLEKKYDQRDLLVDPISQTVKATRDLLLSKFAQNPKKLGDWGFVVDDSPKAKKPPQA